MSTRRPLFLLPCALIAAALTLTACASSDIAATPANVVVAANANPELSTFSKLVKQAGLEGSLEASGPVTVFAPSDEAFKAMPAAAFDKLSKDPAQLKAVLSYHVVPGLKKAADFDGSQAVTTSTGDKMTVSKAGDFLTVDDGMVVKADQPSGNGVIHVIDRVLTPPKK